MSTTIDHPPLAWSFRPGPLPEIEKPRRKRWEPTIMFWIFFPLASAGMAGPAWIILTVLAFVHRSRARWWLAAFVTLLNAPI